MINKLKHILRVTNYTLKNVDPFLLRMAQIAAEFAKESSSKKKFQEYSGIFSEYTDYYMDSETLLKFLRVLRQKLLYTLEDVDARINRLLEKKYTLNYKQDVYKSLESILQRFSNYRVLRLKMYQKYENSWEDVLEPSTIQILEEIEYKYSNTSKLFRNVEQILSDFDKKGSAHQTFLELNKSIEFYSIIKESLPQYVYEINERIEVILYLRKNFVV